MEILDEREQRIEWLACSQDPAYFIHNYCHIYDATRGEWIPFSLWEAQVEAVELIFKNNLALILKARQLGLTWLTLCFALWLMLFRPSATILLFSRREIEAIYLLDKRLKGIYTRLADFLKVRDITSDSSHTWELSNGSVAYAFPTTAGDSYTATLAIVDEADLLPDLDALMLAVKPTIDGGGRMILLSRSNKDTPNSPFKKMFKAAIAKQNGWAALFIPWMARPSRDANWYERQKADILSRTGSVDALYEQYPATPEEALSPRSLNKRLPFEWLNRCYVEMKGEDHESVPGCKVFHPPQVGRSYVMAADPAEGNPTSDDSCAHVFDAITLEEVAVLAGKIEPIMFAQYLINLSDYYFGAPILPERNNHGHAVIAQIRTEGHEDKLLRGLDGNYGWQTTGKSKAILYSHAADLFRLGVPTIHSQVTFLQLCDVQGSTLEAPEGSNDDHAMSCVLALLAGDQPPPQTFSFQHMSIKHATDSARSRTDNSSRPRFVRSRISRRR